MDGSDGESIGENFMTVTQRKSVVRWDAVAVDYRARIVTAGGTITDAAAWAVNEFVLATKAAGIWDKLVDVAPFAGAQLAAALIKLKGPAGTLALTNHNFVGGDYTQATGLNGDGATKYLQTGVNLAAHVGYGAGLTLAAYIREATGAETPAVAAGHTALQIGGEFETDTAFTYGAIPLSFGSGDPGFYAGTIGGADHFKRVYIDGAIVGAPDEGAEVLSQDEKDAEVFLFAGNNDAAAEKFWSGRISFYAFGMPLSTAEIAALYTATQALQTALGRAV